MRASEYRREVSSDGIETDELAELIEDGKMDMALEGLDSRWEEVMRLCERCGFISQAYGGVAVITTNIAYLEVNGPKRLATRLRMNNVGL